MPALQFFKIAVKGCDHAVSLPGERSEKYILNVRRAFCIQPKAFGIQFLSKNSFYSSVIDKFDGPLSDLYAGHIVNLT